ncbi:MAG: putative cupin superfamily protein [Parasphingorhabdus sp.]|jgi:uncharacterized cupin superfamily protein
MSDQTVIPFYPGGPAGDLPDWPAQLAVDLLTPVPEEKGCNYFVDPTGQLTAGEWTCTPYQAAMSAYPVEEFMQLLEGTINFVYADGSEDEFTAGDCFLIPKGTICSWKQTTFVRKFYLIFDNGESTDGVEGQRAIRLDKNTELPELSGLDASRFTGDIPSMSQLNVYTDVTGQWLVGLWQASALELAPATISRSEFAHILEGDAQVINGDGVVFNASKGDSLLVPIGMGYQWRQTGTVRKVFCSFTPKAQ